MTDFQQYIRDRVTVNASGCWLWNLSKDRDGYGEGCFMKRKRKSHRLSYEAFVGQVPEGLQLDHLCRARSCANPAHLEPVTCGENIRRGTSGSKRKTHCKRGHAFAEHGRIAQGGNQCRLCDGIRRRANFKPVVQRISKRGDLNQAAKLRETDIPVIRELAAAGTIHATIAELYGVSRSAIQMVAQRRRWGHVE